MPMAEQWLQGLCKDKERTNWLFYLMGKTLAGQAKWTTKHTTEKWSAYIPVSCEAFLFLNLENNEKVWRAQANNKMKEEKDHVPFPRWTQGRLSGGKNPGWNEWKEKIL